MRNVESIGAGLVPCEVPVWATSPNVESKADSRDMVFVQEESGNVLSLCSPDAAKTEWGDVTVDEVDARPSS